MRFSLFKIGGITIPGYGFMIGVGLIVAYLVGVNRAKRKKLNDDVIIDITLIAALSGFIGAKLLFVILSFEDFLKDPLSIIGSAGFVVYGGIISGILCCYIYTRVKKLNFMQYFDLVMPEISIAQGFGRFGCLMAGCCYGRQTDKWYGIVFPEGGLAPAGVKLIPTQIISAIGDFVIAIILLVLADVVFVKLRKKAADSENGVAGKGLGMVDGDIAALYTFLYGTGRFLIEFLRNDYRGTVGPFSTSQFISIFIILAGIGVMVFNRCKKVKIETDNEIKSE